MFAPRTATGLTIALLALPATATAKSAPPTDLSGGGEGTPAGLSAPAHEDGDRAAVLVLPNPDQRSYAPTSSLAGTTSPRDPMSPDVADATRADEIAQAMERYRRSHPAPPAGADDETLAWPEIAFAGVIVLATAGGVVRARVRRTRRVAA
jgi:hypothetical protein